jgi:hypothetical protein
MAEGRTVQKWLRAYVDGYDLSGYGRNIGGHGIAYDEADMTVWTDSVKGYLRDTPNVDPGTLTTLLDNTATIGPHIVMNSASQNTKRILTWVHGIRGVPTAGNPVFGGQFTQLGYRANRDGKAMIAEIPFGGWAADGTILRANPFGVLLHASAAETAANTATGIDDNGGASASGGYMIAHLLASNAAGTATIKVQDAAVNADGSFADLAGCTTGAVAFGSIPGAVIVATTLPTTAVRQFLRWQLILAGGMTTCTFVLSFFRG